MSSAASIQNVINNVQLYLIIARLLKRLHKRLAIYRLIVRQYMYKPNPFLVCAIKNKLRAVDIREAYQIRHIQADVTLYSSPLSSMFLLESNIAIRRISANKALNLRVRFTSSAFDTFSDVMGHFNHTRKTSPVICRK